MEIAVIIGKRQMERTATLHSKISLFYFYIVAAEKSLDPGRTLATNIPGLDHDGITWQDFVERLNPKVWELRDCDMRFYPHNSKHRDGRHRSDALGTTVSDGAVPVKQDTVNASTMPTNPDADAQSDNAHALQRHQREFKIIFNLLEKLLHPESTKRCTPKTALFHPMLAEPITTAPPPPLPGAWAAKIRRGKMRAGDDAYVPHVPGGGVCGDWHCKDDETGVDCVRILKKCLCLRGGSCFDSESENGSECDGLEERWCGKYKREIVELSSGEGIAVGDRPCEFHTEDVYVYEHP